MKFTDEELLSAIKRHVKAATDMSVSDQEYDESFNALAQIAREGSLVKV